MNRSPDYAGLFETHLTVAPLDVEGLTRFESACAVLGVKCVRIELARGHTRSQPMTGSHAAGTLTHVLSLAHTLAQELAEHGFVVTRIKIEAAPTNADLPDSDADALRHPATNYYEHHVKLLLPTEADLEPLTLLCQRHAAHLSTNAFKSRDDGQCERFVTVRAYGVGRATAEARVENLLAYLTLAGYAIVKRVAEYCVYDSNEEIDAGWLAAE